MKYPLTRRQLLQVSTLAIVSVSGCLDVGFGGQPDRISFEVVNRSKQTKTITVEFFETNTDNVLLLETVELNPDDEREFKTGPIDSQTRYMIQYEVGAQTGDDSVPGSGLHGVEVRIEEDGNVRVSSTVS